MRILLKLYFNQLRTNRKALRFAIILIFLSSFYYLIKKTAYKGIVLIPLENPKFFVHIRIP